MRLNATKAGLIIIIGLGIVLSLAYAQGTVAVPEPVQKIFSRSCGVTGCHQGKYPAMNMSFEPDKIIGSTINGPSKEKPDLKIINTAEPAKSYLLMKIRGDKDIAGKRMPLNATPLKDADIQSIQNWTNSLKGTAAAVLTTQGPGENGRKKNYEVPAFWGTRVINLPTARMIERGHFLFRISHRFYQPVNSGYDSFFGLDGSATTLLGFGYGISDSLGLSLARTNQFQEVELGLHWLIFEQGRNPSLPFSAALHAGTSLITQSRPDKSLFDSDNFKLNVQLSLSHQMSNRLSLLIVPVYSTNTSHLNAKSKGTLALGLGGRFMFLEDISLIGEWVPVLSGYKDKSSGWGLGIEKKIGGHVFQFFVLNVFGLTSDQFVPGGDLLLKDGDFRIGFNIFRTF
jgi:hypothetical protein